jgi:hypothetical protein
MNGLRKSIALFIIIFVGIPTLLGIIWGVGVTRAVVSPEFLSDLPRDIIDRVPTMLDETLEALDQEDVVFDDSDRALVRAVANADTSPKELLENIGVMAWLQNELSQSLEDIGKILRGEMKPKPLTLNLKPLKAALKHEGIDRYLKEVLSKLPACSEEEAREWQEALWDKHYMEHLPPCKPADMDNAVKALRGYWLQEVDEIPDSVDVFKTRRKGWHFREHTAVDISRWIVSLTFLLFFFPAIIFVLAGFIATSSRSGILRWVGFSTLIGGALAFGLSKFSAKMLEWGLGVFPYSYSYTDVSPFEEVVIEKTGDIFLVVVDHLFSAVDMVAGVVCIIGIVLIALSYAMVRESEATAPRSKQGEPSQTPPRQPQQPQAEPRPPEERRQELPQPPQPPAVTGETPDTGAKDDKHNE